MERGISKTNESEIVMQILDRYLLIKYLKTFFFTCLLFSLIAVVIDFSEKVGKFMEDGGPSREEILFTYYPTFIPDINSILWPLFSLIAVVFFCSRMAKNVEFIAMFANGMSFKRIAVPFIIGAAIIAGILFIGNHYILPKTNKVRLDFINDYIDKKNRSTSSRNWHIFISEDTKLYVRHFNASDSVASDVRFEKYNGTRLVETLKASKMSLIEKPNTWRLKDLEYRYFDQLKENYEIKMGSTIDTIMNVYPEDFILWRNDEKRLTSPEIRQYIEKERSRGAPNIKIFEIELYKRTADPISIFILTLIGLSVASRKTRGGVGIHLAVGVSIGAMYIFLSRFSTTFAMSPSMPSLLGVWVPNLIFAGIAWIMVNRAQE